jgi:GT2 family glycosyltransferase
VSIVLVNYRAAADVLTAIEGIRALDWPPDQLQVLVVDNASGDGSSEVLRAGAPDVTVIDSPTNLGFAGGCNLGVQHATGDHVAFLNPDARPHRDWLTSAVSALQADVTVGCVASKVLDWDGENIDFVTGGMSFEGQGYKLHAGQPDKGEFDEPADVLFATGAAMVMPTALFRHLGGFDERYFMFFEDVDLGWRTWLAGYRVRYVPTSLVFHKHHVTMRSYGSWLERYLLSRNALYTIYKNYGDEALERALPAALLLTARRATILGDLDRHAFDLERGPSLDADDHVSIPKDAVAQLYALDTFLEELPALRAARHEVQSRRVKGDGELVHLFNQPFLPTLGREEYVQPFNDAVAAFGVDQVLARRRRVVVATSDVLTPRMAGPAIRAWQMARELSREHEVRLVTKARCEVSHPAFRTEGHVGHEQWPELEAWADVIVFQGFLLHEEPMLIGSTKVIVVDLYDPFHLEQLEASRNSPMGQRILEVGESVRVLNNQIRRGDFFLCASEKQRDFWLGQLSAMQRVNPLVYEQDESLEKLLTVVPFGVDDEKPVRTGPGIKGVVPGIGVDDKVLLWGGGIYNWFDPLTLIRAVDALRERVPEVRLFFLGTKHPNPDVPEMRVAWESRQLATELGLLDTHVFFNDGWVPYEERQNYFMDADVGVSTHLDHVETAFSFRTRVLDYFWTSLPVVCTAGDTLAAIIEERELGITVPAEDVDALTEALHRVLTDQAFLADCRKNVVEVAEEFRWSTALAPLVEFCRTAQRAPDLLVPQAPLHVPPLQGVGDVVRGSLRRKAAGLRQARAEGGTKLVLRRVAGWIKHRLRSLSAG